MKTRICPNCGKNIPSDAITCKFCGRLQFSDGNDIDAENAYPAPEDLPPEDDTFEDGEYEDYDGEYEDYDDGYEEKYEEYPETPEDDPEYAAAARKKMFLIVLAVMAVLSVTLLVILLILTSKVDEMENAESAETTTVTNYVPESSETSSAEDNSDEEDSDAEDEDGEEEDEDEDSSSREQRRASTAVDPSTNTAVVPVTTTVAEEAAPAETTYTETTWAQTETYSETQQPTETYSETYTYYTETDPPPAETDYIPPVDTGTYEIPVIDEPEVDEGGNGGEGYTDPLPVLEQ